MEAWRGYQRDTFPTGSWRHAGNMLYAVAAAERIDLITRQQYRAVWFRRMRIHPLP
jgi:hypothetical protein